MNLGYALAIGGFISLMAGTSLAENHKLTTSKGLPVYPLNQRLLVYSGKIMPFEVYYDPEREWQMLHDPFVGKRPQGVLALRNYIEKQGLTTVIPFQEPDSPEARAAIEFLYGTPVAFAEVETPASAKPRLFPGVALHPGNSARSANQYRGELNPHLGYGVLHGLLDKWREYRFAEQVEPGFMPETIRGDSLDLWREDSVISEISVLQAALTQAREEKIKLDEQTIIALNHIVQRFLRNSAEQYPDGAFIKHILAACTYSKNRLIRSQPSSSKQIVDEFVRVFEWTVAEGARVNGEFSAGGLSFEGLQDYLVAEGSHWPAFVYDLIFNPKRIIVQKGINIGKTPAGFPLEFRIDFLDGEPVLACLRHSWEFLPVEIERVKTALRDFFVSAGFPYHYLSGGADIAITEEGKVRLIEFNFGAESGFMNIGVRANLYASELQGKATPLIALLEATFQQALPEQIAFFRTVPTSVFAHPDVNEAFSIYEWFLNRYLEEWRKHPSSAYAAEVFSNLQALQIEIPKIYERDFMDLFQSVAGQIGVVNTGYNPL